MVRMFHPFWCPHGQIPQDMNSADKKRLRLLYHDLIEQVLVRYANRGGDEDEDDNDDDDGDGGDDDARRARRELRARNAEEDKVLHEAAQRGIRHDKEWQTDMKFRRHARLRAEFHEKLRENRAKRDERDKRISNNARRGIRGLSSATRFSSSETSTQRRANKASMRRGQARMRAQQQKNKTATPGTPWDDDPEEEDALELSDSSHGGEDGSGEVRRRALAYDARRDGEIDLTGELNLIHSDHSSDERYEISDDGNDDADSQCMFYPTDTSSNQGQTHRHSSENSDFIDLSGPASNKGNDSTDRQSARRSHSIHSRTSHRGFKHEDHEDKPDVILVDARQLPSVPVSDDDDVFVLNARALNPTFHSSGGSSADNPFVFDDD